MPRKNKGPEFRAAKRHYFLNETARNVQLTCTVEGCHGKRHGVGSYCKAHSQRKRLHGHPLANRIKLSDYEKERDLINTFLLRHRDHPAIATATELAQSWLEAVDKGVHVPARQDAARLHAHGVTGEQVLAAVLSTWLYLWWTSRHIAHMGLEEVQCRAIGTAVLYLAPRTNLGTTPAGKPKYRVLPGRVRAEAGRYFIKQLSPMFANVVTTAEAEWEAVKQKGEKLMAPFHAQLLAR